MGFNFICIFFNWLIVIIYYNYLGNKKETILIPNGYIGNIYITYDDAQGLYEKEYGAMIFRVPKSGVYKSKSSYYDKLYMEQSNINFYYVDKYLNRKKLKYLYFFEKKDSLLYKNKIIVENIFPQMNKEIPGVTYPYMVYKIDTFKTFYPDY